MLDAGLANDWSAIGGDAAKLVLGGLSLAFDGIFIVQHFCLYRHRQEVDEESERRPLLTED